LDVIFFALKTFPLCHSFIFWSTLFSAVCRRLYCDLHSCFCFSSSPPYLNLLHLALILPSPPFIFPFLVNTYASISPLHTPKFTSLPLFLNFPASSPLPVVSFPSFAPYSQSPRYPSFFFQIALATFAPSLRLFLVLRSVHIPPAPQF